MGVVLPCEVCVELKHRRPHPTLPPVRGEGKTGVNGMCFFTSPPVLAEAVRAAPGITAAAF